MGDMSRFSLWLADMIFNKKASKETAFRMAMKEYGFLERDREWFNRQYKTIEILPEQQGVTLRDGDTVHYTEEESDEDRDILL